VDADLILLVASNPHDADGYADALIGAGQFAFIFARDPISAMSYAESTQPCLAVIALEGIDGPRLAREFRTHHCRHDMRVLLVVDAREFAAARESGAHALVLKPAAAVMVAVEALGMLRRRERRALGAPDRRQAPRGGRRFTDVHLG
jgi:CheY-like chemotaxis protein